MKCCSRSTLGVVIGSLNLIIYAIAIIVSIVILVGVHNMKDTDQHNKELLGTKKLMLKNFNTNLVEFFVMLH